jgi:hypothetical protein
MPEYLRDGPRRLRVSEEHSVSNEKKSIQKTKRKEKNGNMYERKERAETERKAYEPRCCTTSRVSISISTTWSRRLIAIVAILKEDEKQETRSKERSRNREILGDA